MKRLYSILAFGWFWGFVWLACEAGELEWQSVRIPNPLRVSDSVRHTIRLKGSLGWLNTGRQIWVTRDGGQLWQLSLTAPMQPQVGSFVDAFFVDDSHGWVIQHSPFILFHTPDGGQTWQEVAWILARTQQNPPFPEGSAYRLISIYFRDPMNGLGSFTVLGALFTFGEILARTDDGGRTWKEVWASADDTYGRLVGIDDSAWFLHDRIDYYTADFGSNLQKALFKPYSLAFLSNAYGWATKWSPNADGSVVWETSAIRGNPHAETVSILRIRDSTPQAGSTMSGCPFSEQEGAVLWATENAGYLYRTRDGGASWAQSPAPAGTGYQLVCDVVRQELWLVPQTLEENDARPMYRAFLPTTTGVQQDQSFSMTWGEIRRRLGGQ